MNLGGNETDKEEKLKQRKKQAKKKITKTSWKHCDSHLSSLKTDFLEISANQEEEL